jgi:Cysteine-rich CPCC
VKIGVPKIEPVPPSPDGIDYFVNMWGLPADGVFYHCPCCLFPTMPMRGGFEVCPVCHWEDDGQDSHDADRVRGGPNGDLSLSQGRDNFAKTGVCDGTALSRVRPPTDLEMRYRRND